MLSHFGKNTTKNITKSLKKRLLGKKDPDSILPTSIVVAHEILIKLDSLSIANLAKDLWPKIFDYCHPPERIRMRNALATSGKTILDNYTASKEERLYTIAPSLLERIDKAIDAETLQLRQEKAGCLKPCKNLIGAALCIGILLCIITFIVALTEFSQQSADYALFNLIMNVGIGTGAFIMIYACILCPIVMCMDAKINSQYKEFELFLMSTPENEKNHITTFVFWKEIYLYINDQGAYIRTPVDKIWNPDVNVSLHIFLDPALFNQSRLNPKKCEDRLICHQVFEQLEKLGLVYARSHILEKPISTLLPFDEKTENSNAYHKIFKSFAPETTRRNMMFEVRNKYLEYLENKKTMQQEQSEENEIKSVPSLSLS